MCLAADGATMAKAIWKYGLIWKRPDDANLSQSEMVQP
jgi:hypothetical protein